MRLTVNLEEDLYRDARALALAEGVSISRAVNRLLRRGQSAGTVAGPAQKGGQKQRFPTVACRPGTVITDEDVARAEQDEDHRQWQNDRDTPKK